MKETFGQSGQTLSSGDAFRFSQAPGVLTSGGGRPPAPGGQSGSIFFLPLALQKQAGDGSSMVQFLEVKSCWTLSGTSGVSQSSSPIVHGASLRPGVKNGGVTDHITVYTPHPRSRQPCCLTGWDVRPCSGSQSREHPAGRSAASACWRLRGRRHWDTQHTHSQRSARAKLVLNSQCVRGNKLWLGH